MNNLQNFKENITSQSGEDGILKEILKRLGLTKGVCVEFGAWDGINNSNVWRLWHDEGWETLLIEQDLNRYHNLQTNTSSFSKVTVAREKVTPKGTNRLDLLIDKHLNKPIDVLSIDIDGDDYYIFKHLTKHLPKVLIIEHNPTIPPSLEIIQKEGEYFGSSALSLVKLAQSKGYSLVAATDTNCIFILNSLFDLLNIPPIKLKDVFIENHLTYSISSYSGQTFTNRLTPYGKKQLYNFGHQNLLPFQSQTLFHPITTKQKNSFLEKKIKLKNKIKAILKKTFVHKLYKKYFHYRSSFKNWVRHKQKRETVNFYRQKFNPTIFIETGTYKGAMIKAMKNKFQAIFSIELGDDLYQQALQNFNKYKHISILHGDSGKVLKELLPSIKSPSLFWLDAHYSHGDTAKADTETPIEIELETIFNHNIKNHIILIDDARCFNGLNDYPTVETIKKKVAKTNSYGVHIENDIIVIEPKR